MIKYLPFSFQKLSKEHLFISFITSYLVIFNLLFIFQSSWIGELWLSLLPYFLVINIIFSVILIIILVLQIFKFKPTKLYYKISTNFILGFIAVVSIFSNSLLTLKIYDYFYQKPDVEIQTELQNGLKVGFFNILENNTNYNLVDNKLRELNLDVISFAEFDENHYQNIPFLKTYPHFFPNTVPKKNTTLTTIVSTIVIFSKLPFSEVGYKKLANNNALIAKINYNNQNYEIITNHLSNPIIPRYFETRNQDILSLEYLVEAKKDSKVIVLGDFNTTPWSKYYPQFKDYNNVFKGRGVYITWQVGPFALPIDYMFTSKNLDIINYKIDQQNGSDHHLIWATVV